MAAALLGGRGNVEIPSAPAGCAGMAVPQKARRRTSGPLSHRGVDGVRLHASTRAERQALSRRLEKPEARRITNASGGPQGASPIASQRGKFSPTSEIVYRRHRNTERISIPEDLAL